MAISTQVFYDNIEYKDMDLIYYNNTQTFEIVGMEDKLKELEEEVTMYLLTNDKNTGLGDHLRSEVKLTNLLVLKAKDVCNSYIVSYPPKQEIVQYTFWKAYRQIKETFKMIDSITREEERNAC